jgi:hypothetical protein
MLYERAKSEKQDFRKKQTKYSFNIFSKKAGEEK